MADNRSVGRPGLNQGFNQARSVPVEHNKPNLNDQRKVRPHPVADPQMGNRPTGGKQREPKAPPLGKERMQPRDVPVKLMTEAELAEWNPFARKHSAVVPGDALAYQFQKGKIELFHVKDGRIMGPPVEQETYDGLSTKINNFQADMADLKQQRRNMSINPHRAAKAMATTFMRKNGMQAKIGQLGKEIAVTNSDGAQQQQPQQQPAASNDQNPASPFSIDSGPTGRNSGARADWGKRAAKPASAPTAPPAARSASGTPSTPRSMSPPQDGSPATNIPPTVEPTNPDIERKKKVLNQGDPSKYTPQILQGMTPHQIDRGYDNMVHGGRSPMEHSARMRRQGGNGNKPIPAMAAEGYERKEQTKRNPIANSLRHTSHKVKQSDKNYNRRKIKTQDRDMREGYPEASFDDHKEAAHSSRIGDDLFPSRHLQDPTPPDLNREFAQFRDLHIERVSEMAEQEIDELLNQTVSRLGFASIIEADDDESEPESDFDYGNLRRDYTDSGVPRNRNKSDTEKLGESIVRERRRWF